MLKLITKFNQFINESNSNNTIVCCDIQLDYNEWIKFDLSDWADFINMNNNKTIVYLYNGPNMGYADENEQKEWMMNLGIEESVIDNMIFYEKEYGFFRDIMNRGFNHENDIVPLVKYMIDNNINVTDEDVFTEDTWNEFSLEYPEVNSKMIDLLKSGDCYISIPDVTEFLNSYNNIDLVGGGESECLEEIEIIFKALGKNYQTLYEYVY